MKEPRIRFKEFGDGWQISKFDSLIDRISSHSNENTKLPRIEYENINSGLGTLNTVPKNNGKNGIQFKDGDILYGKLRPYLKNWLYAKFNGVAVGDFWVFRAKKGVDSIFMYTLIQSPKYSQVANYSAGSKMPRSDWKFVSKTKFYFPSSIEEQNKIGNYFSSIDNLINTSIEKLEHLKRDKKGYLQKMFPNYKRNKPILRFDEFDSNWIEDSLGNIVSVKTGKSKYIKHNKSIKNSYPILGSTSILGYDNDYDYEGNFLLLARVGNVGSLYTYTGKAKITDNTIYLESNISKFLLMSLKTKDISKFIFGTTRKLIKSSDLKKMKISEPTDKEIFKLEKFFSHLDHLIDLQQQKINHLKQLKQAYLQKMFV